MKILAIHGSPRKNGNTLKTIYTIKTYLEMKGDVEFETFFLGDANLKLCRGCFNCILIGEDKCPLKDSRKALEEKMLSADGVIFAAPGYVVNVPWLMKNFFDRNAFACHRPRYFRQKALLITSAGGPYGARGALKAMSYWVFATGFHIVDKLDVSLLPMKWKEEEQRKIDNKLKDSAEKLHRAIQVGKRPRPSFDDLALFASMRIIAKTFPEEFPADYAYYKERGWMDPKRYSYTHERVPFWRLLVPKLIERLVKKKIARQVILSKGK